MLRLALRRIAAGTSLINSEHVTDFTRRAADLHVTRTAVQSRSFDDNADTGSGVENASPAGGPARDVQSLLQRLVAL